MCLKAVQHLQIHITRGEGQCFSILAITHLQDQPHNDALRLSPLFDKVAQRMSIAANRSSHSDWPQNELMDYVSALVAVSRARESAHAHPAR